jgi:ABC-type polysaccharide/polyol phosphate export permease
MLMQMIIREIKGRFSGSLGGLLWHFMHPILMLLIFLFVFVYIFRIKVGGSGTSVTSAIYLMAGLFPWMILSEGLLRGTNSLIENANLIQKTSFPTEILTTKAVLVPIFSYGIAVILLTLYVILFSHGIIGIIFAIPLVLFLQVLFTLGLAFFCATISVFFRDVIQLVHIVISFWIYLTPILYPISMLPEWAKKVMYLNPLFPLISTYQSLLVAGSLGQWQMISLAVAWALVLFIGGAFVFNKLKYEFADWL